MSFAPAIGLGFALLAEFLEWLLISGLLILWMVTIGWLLIHIANALHFTIRIPHVWTHTIDLGGPFRTAEAGIRTWLEAEQRGIEIEIAWTWNQMRAVWHGTALAVEWLAKETDATFDWLASVRLPKWAKWAAAAALPAAFLAKVVAAVLARIRPELRKAGHVIAHDVPATIVRLVPYAPSIALPNPWAFPRFRRWAKDIAEWRHVTNLRLKRLEALLAASGLALAVARMTGTSLKCWRGQGNIARALRHICGVPKWLLDFALLGTLEAFVATDLCEFAYLLERAAELQVPALMELVSVEDALIGCHGTEKPQLIVLPPADPTPLQGVSPLAA